MPSSDVQQIKCPWCGKIILRNDAARTVSHEVPVCQRFALEVSRLNPDLTTVEVLDVPDEL